VKTFQYNTENVLNFYEYIATGSRVKTGEEINPIFKIKDGGGLLWSKLSAEITHCKGSSKTCQLLFVAKFGRVMQTQTNLTVANGAA